MKLNLGQNLNKEQMKNYRIQTGLIAPSNFLHNSTTIQSTQLCDYPPGINTPNEIEYQEEGT